jgi:hypothetical protein
MKMRRSTLLLFSLLLLVAIADWAFTHRPFGYLYPTTDTRSAFIENYTPDHVQKVIDPFIARQQETSSEFGAGAGKAFVTNQRTVEPYFAIRPEMAARLIDALHDDMSFQLIHDGAKIISTTVDHDKGLHITYRLGQNVGSATVSSSVTNERASHYTLTGAMVEPPEGSEYMIARIAISEKWFPKEEKAVQASLQDH